MLSLRQRVGHLFDTILRYRQPKACPACGCNSGRLVDRKYVVSRLFECAHCKLYYRHPVDDHDCNRHFYQSEYIEGDGITTFLPSDEDIHSLKASGFADIPAKHAGRFRDLLQSLFGDVAGLKLVDYGASWGYISYQLRSFGIDVESYDISKPRAQFGNTSLGLRILTDETSLRPMNDVFLSSHVIEHVPNPTAMLALAKQLVKPRGFVITVCPNGSIEYQTSDPQGFHYAWGKVHPMYLNAAYFRHVAGMSPFFLTASPDGWRRIRSWDQSTQAIDTDISGNELLFVWRPHAVRS